MSSYLNHAVSLARSYRETITDRLHSTSSPSGRGTASSSSLGGEDERKERNLDERADLRRSSSDQSKEEIKPDNGLLTNSAGEYSPAIQIAASPSSIPSGEGHSTTTTMRLHTTSSSTPTTSGLGVSIPSSSPTPSGGSSSSTGEWSWTGRIKSALEFHHGTGTAAREGGQQPKRKQDQLRVAQNLLHVIRTMPPESEESQSALGSLTRTARSEPENEYIVGNGGVKILIPLAREDVLALEALASVVAYYRVPRPGLPSGTGPSGRFQNPIVADVEEIVTLFKSHFPTRASGLLFTMIRALSNLALVLHVRSSAAGGEDLTSKLNFLAQHGHLMLLRGMTLIQNSYSTQAPPPASSAAAMLSANEIRRDSIVLNPLGSMASNAHRRSSSWSHFSKPPRLANEENNNNSNNATTIVDERNPSVTSSAAMEDSDSLGVQTRRRGEDEEEEEAVVENIDRGTNNASAGSDSTFVVHAHAGEQTRSEETSTHVKEGETEENHDGDDDDDLANLSSPATSPGMRPLDSRPSPMIANALFESPLPRTASGSRVTTPRASSSFGILDAESEDEEGDIGRVRHLDSPSLLASSSSARDESPWDDTEEWRVALFGLSLMCRVHDSQTILVSSNGLFDVLARAIARRSEEGESALHAASAVCFLLAAEDSFVQGFVSSTVLKSTNVLGALLGRSADLREEDFRMVYFVGGALASLCSHPASRQVISGGYPNCVDQLSFLLEVYLNSTRRRARDNSHRGSQSSGSSPHFVPTNRAAPPPLSAMDFSTRMTTQEHGGPLSEEMVLYKLVRAVENALVDADAVFLANEGGVANTAQAPPASLLGDAQSGVSATGMGGGADNGANPAGATPPKRRTAIVPRRLIGTLQVDHLDTFLETRDAGPLRRAVVRVLARCLGAENLHHDHALVVQSLVEHLSWAMDDGEVRDIVARAVAEIDASHLKLYALKLSIVGYLCSSVPERRSIHVMRCLTSLATLKFSPKTSELANVGFAGFGPNEPALSALVNEVRKLAPPAQQQQQQQQIPETEVVLSAQPPSQHHHRSQQQQQQQQKHHQQQQATQHALVTTNRRAMENAPPGEGITNILPPQDLEVIAEAVRCLTVATNSRGALATHYRYVVIHALMRHIAWLLTSGKPPDDLRRACEALLKSVGFLVSDLQTVSSDERVLSAWARLKFELETTQPVVDTCIATLFALSDFPSAVFSPARMHEERREQQKKSIFHNPAVDDEGGPHRRARSFASGTTGDWDDEGLGAAVENNPLIASPPPIYETLRAEEMRDEDEYARASLSRLKSLGKQKASELATTSNPVKWFEILSDINHTDAIKDLRRVSSEKLKLLQRKASATAAGAAASSSSLLLHHHSTAMSSSSSSSSTAQSTSSPQLSHHPFHGPRPEKVFSASSLGGATAGSMVGGGAHGSLHFEEVAPRRAVTGQSLIRAFSSSHGPLSVAEGLVPPFANSYAATMPDYVDFYRACIDASSIAHGLSFSGFSSSLPTSVSGLFARVHCESVLYKKLTYFYPFRLIESEIASGGNLHRISRQVRFSDAHISPGHAATLVPHLCRPLDEVVSFPFVANPESMNVSYSLVFSRDIVNDDLAVRKLLDNLFQLPLVNSITFVKSGHPAHPRRTSDVDVEGEHLLLLDRHQNSNNYHHHNNNNHRNKSHQEASEPLSAGEVEEEERLAVLISQLPQSITTLILSEDALSPQGLQIVAAFLRTKRSAIRFLGFTRHGRFAPNDFHPLNRLFSSMKPPTLQHLDLSGNIRLGDAAAAGLMRTLAMSCPSLISLELEKTLVDSGRAFVDVLLGVSASSSFSSGSSGSGGHHHAGVGTPSSSSHASSSSSPSSSTQFFTPVRALFEGIASSLHVSSHSGSSSSPAQGGGGVGEEGKSSNHNNARMLLWTANAAAREAKGEARVRPGGALAMLRRLRYLGLKQTGISQESASRLLFALAKTVEGSSKQAGLASLNLDGNRLKDTDAALFSCIAFNQNLRELGWAGNELGDLNHLLSAFTANNSLVLFRFSPQHHGAADEVAKAAMGLGALGLGGGDPHESSVAGVPRSTTPTTSVTATCNETPGNDSGESIDPVVATYRRNCAKIAEILIRNRDATYNRPARRRAGTGGADTNGGTEDDSDENDEDDRDEDGRGEGEDRVGDLDPTRDAESVASAVHVLFANPLAWRQPDGRLTPMEKLDVSKEQDLLTQSLKEAYERRGTGAILPRLAFDICTPDSLLSVITRKPSVIHWSGHGEREFVCLEDGAGGMFPLGLERLSQMCSKIQSRTTRLVFVSACSSIYVAEAFVKAGIAHVVAVQSRVLDRTSVVFSRAFYLALFLGESIGTAFELGKEAVSNSFFTNAAAAAGGAATSMNASDAEEERRKFVLLGSGNRDEVIFPRMRVSSTLFSAPPLTTGGLLSRTETFPSPLKWRIKHTKAESASLNQSILLSRYIDAYLIITSLASRRVVRLSGEEGLGKSQLCAFVQHYLNLRRAYADGVVTADCEMCASFPDVINNVLYRLVRPTSDSVAAVVGGGGDGLGVVGGHLRGHHRSDSSSSLASASSMLSFPHGVSGGKEEAIVRELAKRRCVIIFDGLKAPLPDEEEFRAFISRLLARTTGVRVLVLVDSVEPNGGMDDVDHVTGAAAALAAIRAPEHSFDLDSLLSNVEIAHRDSAAGAHPPGGLDANEEMVLHLTAISNLDAAHLFLKCSTHYHVRMHASKYTEPLPDYFVQGLARHPLISSLRGNPRRIVSAASLMSEKDFESLCEEVVSACLPQPAFNFFHLREYGGWGGVGGGDSSSSHDASVALANVSESDDGGVSDPSVVNNGNNNNSDD